MCSFILVALFIYVVLCIFLGSIFGNVGGIIALVLTVILGIIGLIAGYGRLKDDESKYGKGVITTRGRLIDQNISQRISVYIRGFSIDETFYPFSDILDVDVSSHILSYAPPLSTEYTTMTITLKHGGNLIIRGEGKVDTYNKIKETFLNYVKEIRENAKISHGRTNLQEIKITNNGFTINGIVYFFIDIVNMEINVLKENDSKDTFELTFQLKSGKVKKFNDEVGSINTFRRIESVYNKNKGRQPSFLTKNK
jgi:hypothetical protein